jgi:hypothetical protein
VIQSTPRGAGFAEFGKNHLLKGSDKCQEGIRAHTPISRSEKRGVSKEEAEARAWATVNKESGEGKKSRSGRGKKVNRTSSRKGGKKGGKKTTTKAGRKATKKGGRKGGRKASKK